MTSDECGKAFYLVEFATLNLADRINTIIASHNRLVAAYNLHHDTQLAPMPPQLGYEVVRDLAVHIRRFRAALDAPPGQSRRAYVADF